MWIDDEAWREQATYERDTNAWVDDPYDRVPASEVAEDARALHACAHALGMAVSAAPHPDVDETLAAAQACLDALSLARRILDPAGPDDRRLQVPEIAEACTTRGSRWRRPGRPAPTGLASDARLPVAFSYTRQ